MQVRVDFSKTTLFDKLFRKKYIKQLNDNIVKEVNNAAKKFVEAAAVLVPVDTGFARGSYLALANKIGTNIAISPKNKYSKIYKHTDGSLTLKKPEFSSQFSTPIESVIIQRKDGVTFTFDVSIIYFEINDPNRWRSLEAGRRAFLDYLNSAKIAPRI